MSMCSECAKVLRMQSNKCPICRTSIESLLQIKISRQEKTEEKTEEKTLTLTKEETEAEPCAPPSPGASAPASSSGLSA